MLIRLINRSCSKRFYSGTQQCFDIIIAGGGMIGSTLACTLGKNPKLANSNILLLEANNPKPFSLNPKPSNRVSFLNPSTISLLKSINAWDTIESSRAEPVKSLQVWDGVSDALIVFENNENSFIVENDLLVYSVNEELKQLSNVKIETNSRIKQIVLPDHCADTSEVCLENGNKFYCKLLLGCDGANSQVRQAMQTNYVKWSYDQMGVVATLGLEEVTERGIAWQRFLPNGPIALLPLNGDHCSLVWSTTPTQAKQLLKLTEQEFVDEINKAMFQNFDHSTIIDKVMKDFNGFLRMMSCPSDSSRRLPPKVTCCESGSRAAFPLGFGHSTNYIRKGAALVGDAAHRVHPLAGMGVNLGFGDVEVLNRVLGDAVYSGSEIADINHLKDYESERQCSNVPKMLAIDGLNRLYSTDFSPLVLLRSIGLQATNALTPLKKIITAQAGTS